MSDTSDTQAPAYKKRSNNRRPIESLTRFPLRLVPKHDESSYGFLMRFADQYDCTPSTLGNVIGAVSLGMKDWPADIQRFAIVADLTPVEVARLFPRRADNYLAYQTTIFMGQRFFSNAISNARRVCPRCLIASNYDRAIWALKCVSICTEHRIDLIVECPSCAKALDWSVRDPALCKCGYDLRQACDHLAPKPKPTNEERAERFMVDLFKDDKKEFPPGLADIPILDFCVLMIDFWDRFTSYGTNYGNNRRFHPLKVWEGFTAIHKHRAKVVSEMAVVVQGGYRRSLRQTEMGAMHRTLVSLQRDRIGIYAQQMIEEALAIGLERRQQQTEQEDEKQLRAKRKWQRSFKYRDFDLTRTY